MSAPAPRSTAPPGALWLEPLLGKLPAGRIVVAPGAQAALAAVLSLRARAGDTILAEQLTYPGLISAAAQLGLRVVGVETDGEGPLPQALEAACRLHAPRLVYLLPTMQNPTTRHHAGAAPPRDRAHRRAHAAADPGG